MTTVTRNRSVLLAPSLFAALRSLGGTSSSADAVEALREAGYQAGESVHSLFDDFLADSAPDTSPTDLPSTRFWEQFSRFWAATGWGELQHRDIHRGVAVLESSDWIEAELTEGISGCHVTTGMLADLLRRIADQEIAILEVECRSRGDQSCRFVIGSADTLQAVYSAMRRGASLEQAVSELS